MNKNIFGIVLASTLSLATLASQEDTQAQAYTLAQLAATTAVTGALNPKAGLALSVDVRAAVVARMNARQAIIKGRLDKLAGQRAKIKASLKDTLYVDNKDGTSSKTIEIKDERVVNGKTATRDCKLQKLVKTEGTELLSWHVEFKQTLPSGLTRVSTRDKTLQADGSYLVTFHTVLTLANGRSRTADWSKTIAADGTVTGKGTIVWKDKAGVMVKSSSIVLGGDEDKATAKVAETGGTVEMSVSGPTTIKGDDGTSKAIEDDSASADTNVAADAAII